MWSNNPFGVNDSFPIAFNQEDFLFPSPSFPNSSGPLEPHYHRSQHDVLVGLGAPNRHNDTGLLTNNSFKSEMEIFQSTFDMNTKDANTNTQCVPRPQSAKHSANPSPRPTPPQISSRAAELKAQLLARRANTATQPAGKTVVNPGLSVNVNGVRQEKTQTSSSSRQSSQVPLIAEKQEQELNLNDLISQYSDSKSMPGSKTDQKNSQVTSGKSTIQDPPPPKDSVEGKLPSATIAQSNKNPEIASEKKNKTKPNDKDQGRKPAEEIDIETSEGEIIEERRNSTNKTKENSNSKSSMKGEDKQSRKPSQNQAKNPPQNRSPREVSESHRSQSANSQTQRRRDNRRTEVDSRLEEKNHIQGTKTERKQNSNPEKHTHSGHDYHVEGQLAIGTECNRTRPVQAREREGEPRSAVPPALDDILVHDTDLREWLEITCYHNKPYRDKILTRRRAIAALDAQRERLIAEIEAEERGGISVARAQSSTFSMLPPPIPSYKSSERLGNTISPIPTDRYSIANSNKRTYTQAQDSWEEHGSDKMARIESMNYSPLIKEGPSLDNGRPRSSDAANRHVIDRPDDSSRPYSNSRDPNLSPGQYIPFERRSPSRIRGYECNLYDDDEISETGSRILESRGNYRGRGFDSKYRGRGRGRGRGDIRDSRVSPEPRGETSSGSKSVNGRPSKNSRGGSRSSRGN